MNWAGWIGVLVGAGALVFAYLAWRVSRQQLRLAQEQAELRPELVVSEMQLIGLREAGVPDDYVTANEQAKVQRALDRARGVEPTSPPPPDKVLQLKLSNRGRVAATQVVGKLFLRAAHLQPPAMVLPSARVAYAVGQETSDGYFVVRTQRLPHPLLTAEEPVRFDIAVCVRATTRTSVKYEFVSAEGGSPATGEVSLEVTPT